MEYLRKLKRVTRVGDPLFKEADSLRPSTPSPPGVCPASRLEQNGCYHYQSPQLRQAMAVYRTSKPGGRLLVD